MSDTETPTQPPPDPDGQPPSEQQTMSWREGLPEEIRASPSLTKFNDVTSLAKSYTELERHVNDKGVRLPGKDASPAEVRAAMAAIGCPDEPDALGGWDIPEGLPVDEGFVKHMREAAWNVGLTPEQWKRLGGDVTGFQQRALQDAQQREQEAQANLVRTLESEWGAETNAKLKLAREAAEAIFGEDRARAMMLTTEEGRIGNDAALAKTLAQLGEAMGEAGLLNGRAPSGVSLTPDSAKQQWEQLQADPDFVKDLMDKTRPGHAAALERQTTLYNAMHSGPQGPTPTGRGVTVGTKNFS